MNSFIPHKTIPKNRQPGGRDFVVGDLHGQFTVFQNKLAQVNFDPFKDRVFFVGDLVDRGPESFECLKLLAEPWAHCVLSNHGIMAMQYFELVPEIYSTAWDFIRNGGGWVRSLTSAQLKVVRDLLAFELENSPLVMTVESDLGDFDVTHAAKMLPYENEVIPDEVFFKELVKLSDEEAVDFVWNRSLVRQCMSDPKAAARFEEYKSLVQANGLIHRGASDSVFMLEDACRPGIRLTYVGHNVIPYPVFGASHVFLDTGAARMAIPDGEGVPADITLVEHGQAI